jgi:hypothetical protein
MGHHAPEDHLSLHPGAPFSLTGMSVSTGRRTEASTAGIAAVASHQLNGSHEQPNRLPQRLIAVHAETPMSANPKDLVAQCAQHSQSVLVVGVGEDVDREEYGSDAPQREERQVLWWAMSRRSGRCSCFVV